MTFENIINLSSCAQFMLDYLEPQLPMVKILGQKYNSYLNLF